MRTGQSVKACLRREVPTDHEARGQAQRRQLRRVATELRRDCDPEAEAKHAKHGRIRTQISYLSRMTSDRGGEQTVTSTHSGWRGRRWCWSVQQTTQHNDVSEQLSSGEACGRDTWVSTWTSKQLVESKGSREATPKSDGVPWGGREGGAAHKVP